MQAHIFTYAYENRDKQTRYGACILAPSGNFVEAMGDTHHSDGYHSAQDALAEMRAILESWTVEYENEDDPTHIDCGESFRPFDVQVVEVSSALKTITNFDFATKGATN